MKSSIDEESKNKQVSCVDTRDGETFQFNTNSIYDVRVGYGADTSFSLTDDDGKKRTLTSSMEVFMKCEDVNEGVSK